MIPHNAQRIEFKLKFILSLFDGVKKNLSAFMTTQLKFTIVAAHSNVVTIVGFEVS